MTILRALDSPRNRRRYLPSSHWPVNVSALDQMLTLVGQPTCPFSQADTAGKRQVGPVRLNQWRELPVSMLYANSGVGFDGSFR